MPLRWGPADSEKIVNDHGDWLVLADGESIEFAAKTRRDMLIFTDRRIVITDTQGMIRKKTEYKSVPYRSLSRWSVESSKGLMDGADLKLWFGSEVEPQLTIELQKDESARDVMALLSTHAM